MLEELAVPVGLAATAGRVALAAGAATAVPAELRASAVSPAKAVPAAHPDLADNPASLASLASPANSQVNTESRAGLLPPGLFNHSANEAFGARVRSHVQARHAIPNSPQKQPVSGGFGLINWGSRRRS